MVPTTWPVGKEHRSARRAFSMRMREAWYSTFCNGGGRCLGAPGCSQCRDAWVAGLSTGGKVLWTATADGEAGLNDAIYAMAKAPNGDLLVAGRVQCGGLVAGEHPFVARLRPG